MISEIVVPNFFQLQTILFLYYLLFSLKISINFPPLPKGTAKIHIFSYLQNFYAIFLKNLYFDAIIPIFGVL